MTMNRRSRVGVWCGSIVSLCGAIALFQIIGAGQAVAGQKWSYPVYVGSNYAVGSIGTARNSADSTSAITCTLSGWSTYTAVSCSAVDSTGKGVYCYTPNNSAMDLAVSGINSDSYVYFSWDSTGACTYIEVEAGSSFELKQP